MRTVRDHYSGDLFDPFAHLGPQRRVMLENSWAGLVRRTVLGQLPVNELAACFHPDMGRPGKDLHVAMGVLLLQQLHDLSDAAAVEALAFNELWHYALDARGEQDMYLCQRTLRNYRALVIKHGLDQVLFRTLTDHLIKTFNVDTTRQRLDSTALRSNMRQLTRLGILCQTLELFLRELGRHDPGLLGQVQPALLQRYATPAGGCFGSARPSEAKRRLPEAAADLLTLVRAFAATSAAALPGYQLMQRVLEEQCQVIPAAGDDGEKLRVKENEELPSDGLQNPSDPTSTYSGHKGPGYAGQVMETYQPKVDESGEPLKPDLITHVALGAICEYDGKGLDPALADTAARKIAPGQLLGDTHYGANEKIQSAAEVGVELISPAQPPAGSQQQPRRLSLEQFVLGDEGLVKQCPAGHAPLSVSASVGGNYQARFDAATCAACPLRRQCPVQAPRSPGDAATRLQYDQQRLEMRQRRLAEQEELFKDRYRWRAGIEATMSRLKHQMGLAALRVRGRAAVSYKLFMAALGLNILRCARCVAVNQGR